MKKTCTFHTIPNYSNMTFLYYYIDLYDFLFTFLFKICICDRTAVAYVYTKFMYLIA